MIMKYDNPSITMSLLYYSTMTFDHVTWKITLGIIHSVGAITVQSMVTIEQLGEKELQLKHSFFKMTEGPTDMWKKGNMTSLIQRGSKNCSSNFPDTRSLLFWSFCFRNSYIYITDAYHTTLCYLKA